MAGALEALVAAAAAAAAEPLLLAAAAAIAVILLLAWAAVWRTTWRLVRFGEGLGPGLFVDWCGLYGG
jgi:hypothetical protein